MNKKGVTLPLKYTLYAVAGVTVILLFMNAGSRLASAAASTEAFLASDIAAQLDTAYSLAENGYLITDDVEKYVEIDQTSVKVADSQSDFFGAEVQYNPSKQVLSAELDHPGKVYALRNGNDVSIQAEEPKLVKLRCANIDTTLPDWKNTRFVLDPSVSEGQAAAQASLSIAQSLKRIYNENFIVTRDSAELVALDERLKIAADSTLLAINFGTSPLELNTAIAKINYHSRNADKSTKLACTILNALADTFDIDAMRIIPVDPLAVPENDPLQILNTDSVAVHLEIGNLNTEAGRDLLRKTSEIPKPLFDALQEYYET